MRYNLHISHYVHLNDSVCIEGTGFLPYEEWFFTSMLYPSSYIFTCTSRTGYCINYIAQIIAQITEEYPKNAKHYTTTTKPTVNKDRRPKRGTFGDRFDGSDLLFKQGENLKIENNFTYAEHAHKKGIRKFLS